jgi:hypothetical protein
MRVLGDGMRFRTVRLLIGLVAVLFFVLGPVLIVSASEVVVATEESPYTPPEVDQVDLPNFLRALEPLARLPLWGQAAVLSAGVAGMFFVVPMVFRWVWNLGEDREDEWSANEKNGSEGRHAGADGSQAVEDRHVS